MKLKSSLLALVLSAAGCMIPASAQVTYQFENVQYSSGGVTDTFTQFLGINNQGVVAGYHGAAINKGFTYFSNTKTFVNENFPGSAQTQVTGLNNIGKSVGFYITTSGETRGFQFGSGQYISSGFPGTPFNQLLGQNDHGESVGYYSTLADGTGPDHAYAYVEGGQVFSLYTIPGSVQAQATGLNNAGDICGFTIDSKNHTHGWFLVLGQYLQLDFPNSSATAALGINNVGQIVGSYNDASGNGHGFVYEIATKKWQEINDPDGVNTVVNGINDKGVLVGFFGNSPDNTAFIATPQP